MRVWVLGTGSSGNLLLVEVQGTRIFLDAGIGPKKAAIRMRELGGELFPRGADAIVPTHEHNDHCAQLESLAKALQMPKKDFGEPGVLLHDGMIAERVRHRFETKTFAMNHGSVSVGPITIESLGIPHDAPQIAIRVTAGELSFGYATDLGSSNGKLAAFLGACDTVLLESNYEEKLLDEGPYPLKLKRRIAGPLGHLSNEQTAALLAEVARHGHPRVLLCHLSKLNNTPELAQRAARAACPALDVSVLEHGEAKIVDVVRTRHRAAKQLSLLF